MLIERNLYGLETTVSHQLIAVKLRLAEQICYVETVSSLRLGNVLQVVDL